MASEPAFEIATAPESVDHPVLEFYLQYWHRKRSGRAMPSRADVKPQELKPHLGSAILLEALPGLDDFRYRLVGTRVTEYFLGDATGSTIRQVYLAAGLKGPFVENIIRLHRSVCESRVIIRVKGSHGEWQGKLYPPFDALYLPLSDDGKAANMVLTAFCFDRAALRVLRPKPPPLKPV